MKRKQQKFYDEEDFNFEMEEGNPQTDGNDNNNQPFYSGYGYAEYAKKYIENVDWEKVAQTTLATAEVVAEKALVATLATAEVVGSVSAVAAKGLRSAIVFNGPEPLASVVALLDTSAFPRHIDRVPLSQRLKYFEVIKRDYPDRVPIIVEKAPGSRLCLEKNTKKFLVPCETMLGNFIVTVRNTIKIPPYESFWLVSAFDHGCILSPHTQNLSHFYNKYVSEDGFLYLHIREQNAFG